MIWWITFQHKKNVFFPLPALTWGNKVITTMGRIETYGTDETLHVSLIELFLLITCWCILGRKKTKIIAVSHWMWQKDSGIFRLFQQDEEMESGCRHSRHARHVYINHLHHQRNWKSNTHLFIYHRCSVVHTWFYMPLCRPDSALLYGVFAQIKILQKMDNADLVIPALINLKCKRGEHANRYVAQ